MALGSDGWKKICFQLGRACVDMYERTLNWVLMFFFSLIDCRPDHKRTGQSVICGQEKSNWSVQEHLQSNAILDAIVKHKKTFQKNFLIKYSINKMKSRHNMFEQYIVGKPFISSSQVRMFGKLNNCLTLKFT